MFHLSAIKETHAKVKSGADFPAYVGDLYKLGVKKYDTFVADGHTVYVGDNDYQVTSAPVYATLHISGTSDAEKFNVYLKDHQSGLTDYPTFCKQAAATGVEKWTVDMIEMTCTYYDKSNSTMLEEQIPTT
jgi:uncharacterized protein YbcV (DUF1398 family)